MNDRQVIHEGGDEATMLRRRLTELEQLLGIRAAATHEWTQRYNAEQTARIAAETGLARSPLWVALAVHELRTLFTVVFGHAQILERALQARDKLFQRFYRADNTDDLHIDGLGVGLYLVHQIVTLHGGTIKVDSQEGIGSTFTVGLPISIPVMASQAEG